MQTSRLIAGLLAMSAAVAGYFVFVRIDESSPAVGAASSRTSSGPPASRQNESADELLVPRVEVATPVDTPEPAPATKGDELEASIPVAPPKDTWPQTILDISDEAWAKQHEGASRTLVAAEAKRIQEYIVKASEPEFDKRWNAGQTTFIAYGDKYDSADWDPLEVRRVYMAQNTISKIVLPKDEFPELYNLNAKYRWCEEAARDPKRQQH